jgi:hypothetical protein
MDLAPPGAALAMTLASNAKNRGKRKPVMIDDPRQTKQLLSALEAALPLESRISPQLAAILRDKIPNLKPLQRCQISRVFYTGDDGGIVCSLELPEADAGEVYLASITHLLFDPRLPLVRPIALYQKHRAKRIRRGAEAH